MNTPTPSKSKEDGHWSSHQRRERWIKTVPLKTSEELETELAAVTEQLKETQKHLKDANRGAEINAHALRINADKLIAVTEQRDKYRDIASELIAIIRINVMRDTFKIATIEQVDEHLKPWIERIAAVKGVEHE